MIEELNTNNSDIITTCIGMVAVLMSVLFTAGCIAYTPDTPLTDGQITAEVAAKAAEQAHDIVLVKLRFSFFDRCMARMKELPSHVNGVDIPPIIGKCTNMSYAMLNNDHF